jgi:hypothetical protein
MIITDTHTCPNTSHLESLVDQSFIKELLEHPPHRLHELRIHGLVVVVEVDPTTKTIHCCSPFLDF